MDIVIGVISGIAIALLLLVVFGVLIRRRLMSAGKNITAETARDAADGLDEAVHRAIYTNLAQGRQVQAVAAYRQSKKAGSIEAVRAIAALERFPQQFRRTGQQRTGEPDVVTGEVLGSAPAPDGDTGGSPGSAALDAVERDDAGQPLDPDPRFDADARLDPAQPVDPDRRFDADSRLDAAESFDPAQQQSQHENFSVDELPGPVRDQLDAAVRDADVPAAAQILAGNSPLSETAARSVAQAVVEDRHRR